MSLYDNLLESIIYEDSIEEYNTRKFIDILFKEDFEISAEEINRLVESFPLVESNFESLTEGSKISKAFTGPGAAKLDNEVTRTGTYIGNLIKSGGITKNTRSKIADALDNFKKDVEKYNDELLGINLSESDKKKLSKFDSKNVAKAAVLLAEVIIVNDLCISILNIVFGPAGDILGACIIAPLTEETAKGIAIKNNYVAEFTAIFNIYEAASYIIKASVIGIPFRVGGFAGKYTVPVKNMVRARAAGVAMHISTTIVQWLSTNPKLLAKLGIDENDESGKKEKVAFIGQVIAMIMHASWNLASTTSKSFRNTIMGNFNVNIKNTGIG